MRFRALIPVLFFLILCFLYSGSVLAENLNISSQDSILKDELSGLKKRSTYVFKSGAVYTGQIRLFKPHGYGQTLFVNGDTHVGEYSSGLREGYGVYQFIDGEKYQGEWSMNSQHGKGTYFFANGDRYTGNWDYDYQNGFGEIGRASCRERV